MLHLAVAFAFSHRTETQVELLDILVIPQLLHRAVQNDPTVFHDIPMVGDIQGYLYILLHEQNGKFIFPVNPVYDGEKKLGKGKGYKYAHDYEGGFVAQEYLPVKKKYYEPKEIGFEKKIKQRMDELKKRLEEDGK